MILLSNNPPTTLQKLLYGNANILLRRGGIWNLAQTPSKNFKLTIFFISVTFESKTPNPISLQKDVCYQHHDWNKPPPMKKCGVWLKRQVFQTPRFAQILEFWTTDLDWEWCYELKNHQRWSKHYHIRQLGVTPSTKSTFSLGPVIQSILPPSI